MTFELDINMNEMIKSMHSANQEDREDDAEKEKEEEK